MTRNYDLEWPFISLCIGTQNVVLDFDGNECSNLISKLTICLINIACINTLTLNMYITL